ncbi:alpha/beta hydrolase [Edaphobacter sp. 4G125]|nr:alpha/beta hydrolase [Edaphobacter sp. 4G125]
MILLVTAAIAGSSSFNAIAIRHFWSSHPPSGQFVQVNGRRMYINCTGSGSPTVILDAGLGNDSTTWGEIQPVLSKTTRVCSYDRAGFGWSDPQLVPRDADHIADELHQMLFQADVTGPIILMGHSIAGLYVRDYATRYPDNVVGMVLIDVSTPLQDQNPAFNTGSKGPPSWLYRAAMIAGIPRLIGMCSPSAQGANADFRKLRAEDICRMHYSAMSGELDSFQASGEETVHTGPYGSLPILIISHDPAKVLVKSHSTKQEIDRQDAWTQMQEDLKKLSTRSQRIIAKDSTHNVMIDRPDLIENKVTLFIEEVRGHALQLTKYGDTTTE